MKGQRRGGVGIITTARDGGGGGARTGFSEFSTLEAGLVWVGLGWVGRRRKLAPYLVSRRYPSHARPGVFCARKSEREKGKTHLISFLLHPPPLVVMTHFVAEERPFRMTNDCSPLFSFIVESRNAGTLMMQFFGSKRLLPPSLPPSPAFLSSRWQSE